MHSSAQNALFPASGMLFSTNKMQLIISKYISCLLKRRSAYFTNSILPVHGGNTHDSVMFGSPIHGIPAFGADKNNCSFLIVRDFVRFPIPQ